MRDRITKEEIGKWLDRIKNELKNIKATGKKAEELLENIKAYVSDCEHWMKEEDYVLGFESVIWAWAWYEIGKELRLIH